MVPDLLVDEISRRDRYDSQRNLSSQKHNGKDSVESEDVSNSDSKSLSRCDSFCSSLTFSPPRVAPAPCSAKVRARFLNRLGISPPQDESKFLAASRSRGPTRFAGEPSFQVSLKDDDEVLSKQIHRRRHSFGFFLQQSTSLSSSSSSDSKPFMMESSERSVSFSPSVTVHPIPKHTAYSSRIRDAIWTKPTEMQESAARNCLEFAAENWDWRQVAEDEDMVYYEGELVHPVHFAHEYNIRKQFCAVMSAQSQASR